MLLFICPNCSNEKNIDGELLGRRLKCPKCKTSVRADEENCQERINDRPAEMQITVYDVNSSPLGLKLAYKCPACFVGLTSPLDNAGGQDHCPDCKVAFVVPGEAEYAAVQKSNLSRLKLEQQETIDRKSASVTATLNRAAEKGRRASKFKLDRDPLVEWILYVLAIGVILSIAAGRYFVAAVMNDDSHLVLLILTVFIIGFLTNMRGILQLRSEYVCADACIGMLKQKGGIVSLANSPPAGVFHKHVADLASISKFDANLSQDSLITLLYSRMMAKSRIVDVLSGVLVSLGLIGTIVGLISMTDGLSVTLNALGDDAKADGFLAGMRETMAGLGTAFYTTLVGAILGSVVLKILNNVYSSNVDHLMTYLAQITEVHLIPKLKNTARRKLENENTK